MLKAATIVNQSGLVWAETTKALKFKTYNHPTENKVLCLSIASLTIMAA
jgi:hypothetical protein